MFPEMSEIRFNCNICWWKFQILDSTWFWLSMTLALNQNALSVNLNHYLSNQAYFNQNLWDITHKFTNHRVHVICISFKSFFLYRPCNSPLPRSSQLVKSLLRKSQSCRTRIRCRTTPPTSWAPPRCPRRSSWVPPYPPPPTAMSTQTPCSSDSSSGAVFDFQMFLWYPTTYSCRRNIWNSHFPNISVTSTYEPFSAMQPLLLNPHRGAISKYAEKKVSICEKCCYHLNDDICDDIVMT